MPNQPTNRIDRASRNKALVEGVRGPESGVVGFDEVDGVRDFVIPALWASFWGRMRDPQCVNYTPSRRTCHLLFLKKDTCWCITLGATSPRDKPYLPPSGTTLWAGSGCDQPEETEPQGGGGVCQGQGGAVPVCIMALNLWAKQNTFTGRLPGHKLPPFFYYYFGYLYILLFG